MGWGGQFTQFYPFFVVKIGYQYKKKHTKLTYMFYSSIQEVWILCRKAIPLFILFASLLLVDPSILSGSSFPKKRVFAWKHLNHIARGKEENILRKYKLNCFLVETWSRPNFKFSLKWDWEHIFADLRVDIFWRTAKAFKISRTPYWAERCVSFFASNSDARLDN